ncbi:hypothetical protein ILYODFUR_033440 [Ilyodon furcidens]|uniref:Uncharacterized protein n=1 Tax=Ilyodon furcidens TaxID=33524 RepID=A0ABV0TZW2_9TELE
MQAAQNETDTLRFLQMYSQVNQDVEKAKAVDLRKGLEPGSHWDKLVLEIRQNGEKMVNQASNFLESLLTLVDPESHQDLDACSDLIFEPQTSNCSMSLSKDRRTVFYNSWLGECSATLLIHSTQSVPSNQRWMLSLTDVADWMIGLCDKQSAKNPMNGPVYGLSFQDNRLSCVTAKYDEDSGTSLSSGASGQPKTGKTTTGKQFKIKSTFFKPKDKSGEHITGPGRMEVLWSVEASRLSFFSRTGRYQRDEIIIIEVTPNICHLVPFVQTRKENVKNTSKKQWKCSCGQLQPFKPNCSNCGQRFSGPFITEVVCELY